MARIGDEGGVVDAIDLGSGRAVLLLHSMLADRSAFDAIVPALAERRRVILPDLPGFGGSDRVAGGVDAIAARICEAIDALGVGEFDIIGNGFGSFVALAIATREKERVGAAVLAGGGTGFPEPGKVAFRVMADKVGAEGMGAIVDAAVNRLFPEEFIAARPDLVAHARRNLLAIDPVHFVHCCRVLVELDLTDTLPDLKSDLLVVVGELDLATTPAMARDLVAAVPGARLEMLAGVGHAPTVQAPEAFLAAVAGTMGLGAFGAEPLRQA